ncbi:hypothetical protein P3T37_000278 [Kitasatospora sp. MAA4]|uniref:hypothetical protein n=1 Tax=Kitasatospora sp. MAA4 TaxID=3035093 RepID=UPI002473260E|nr:hypothetical protein [Kitasatospora sp. MAA4]MDH6130911.1 hypothetical protein [Kitasatospora sp. MAA4]
MTHGTENSATSLDSPLVEAVDRTREVDTELRDEELDVVVAGVPRTLHGWGMTM